MITATLYGRIARDPEQMQPSNGGESYVRFSMAVETGRKDQDGNRIAQFINISVSANRAMLSASIFIKVTALFAMSEILKPERMRTSLGSRVPACRQFWRESNLWKQGQIRSNRGRPADPLRDTVRRSRIAQLPLRRHCRACRYKDLCLPLGTREVLTDGRH